LPEFTGLGANLALTPFGKPAMLNVTEVVLLFTFPMLTLTELLEPRVTESDVGVTVIVNWPLTVTVNVVLWLRLELPLSVPLTVT
jgi:hypothetical protein